MFHPRCGRGTSLTSSAEHASAPPIVVGVVRPVRAAGAFLIVLPLMLFRPDPAPCRGDAPSRGVPCAARSGSRRSAPRTQRRRESTGRLEGESYGQAAIRLARTGPVEEGGDLLVIGISTSVRPDPCCSGRRCGPAGGVPSGRNGVGKTTAQCPRRAGRMAMASCTTDSASPVCPADPTRQAGITLMSAGRSIFPTLTVEENIWMAPSVP
jgi:hypothetical protein